MKTPLRAALLCAALSAPTLAYAEKPPLQLDTFVVDSKSYSVCDAHGMLFNRLDLRVDYLLARARVRNFMSPEPQIISLVFEYVEPKKYGQAQARLNLPCEYITSIEILEVRICRIDGIYFESAACSAVTKGEFGRVKG